MFAESVKRIQAREKNKIISLSKFIWLASTPQSNVNASLRTNTSLESSRFDWIPLLCLYLNTQKKEMSQDKLSFSYSDYNPLSPICRDYYVTLQSLTIRL